MGIHLFYKIVAFLLPRCDAPILFRGDAETTNLHERRLDTSQRIAFPVTAPHGSDDQGQSGLNRPTSLYRPEVSRPLGLSPRWVSRLPCPRLW